MLLSGAEVCTTEATAVSSEGRITHGGLGLIDDAIETALGGTVAGAPQYGRALTEETPARRTASWTLATQ